MVFAYDFTETLKKIIKKLKKKDMRKVKIIKKKIDEIINSDENTIEHYKNLSRDSSDKKRVHIDKSFVLMFKYVKEKKFILFLDFDHHDNAYKK